MEQQVEHYLDHIRNEYVRWSNKAGISNSPDPVRDRIRKEMIDKFISEVRYEEGNKYIKVIHGGSVHSFIVKKDNKEFKAGDILKAASWASPARNFARGNILTGSFQQVQWTGA